MIKRSLTKVKTASKFSKLSMSLIVVLVAGVGTYLLVSSRAASGTCTTTVSSVSAIQSAVSSAASGQVVCVSPGTYGSITLSGVHSGEVVIQPDPALDPNTNGKVTFSGIDFSGSYITARNFYVTNNGVNFGAGSSNSKLDSNDITASPGDYGVNINCGSAGCSNIVVTHNKIHDLTSTVGTLSGSTCTNWGGDGDALRLDSKWDHITYSYNEITRVTQVSGNCVGHNDCLQEYASNNSNNLIFDHNYIHDAACEAFLIKDSPVDIVSYTNNLFLNVPPVGQFFDTNHITFQKNTFWNSSVLFRANTSGLVATVDHNVLQNGYGNGCPSCSDGILPMVITASNNINGGTTSQFVNASGNDYRLASNPNGIGVDWKPADYVYGPVAQTVLTPPDNATSCQNTNQHTPGGPDGNGKCWPDASNTGIPSGTNLTPYTGPVNITTPNTVIDSKIITHGLNIQAPGVVVKNSKISGVGAGEDVIAIDTAQTSASVTVTDSEIDANSGPFTGIGDINWTATNVNIHNGHRGVHCYDNCVLTNSYLHDQWVASDGSAHESGARMGQRSTFQHNTLWCSAPNVPPDGGCSADLTGYGDWTPIHDNTIDNNLFVATIGGACAYGGSSKGSNGSKPYGDQAYNVIFKNNIFQKGYNGKCGAYFPITDFDSTKPGNQWTNNKYDDGTLLNSDGSTGTTTTPPPSDTTPPTTTISSTPSNPTTNTSASFSFSANETSTYKCSLDNATLASCTSPKTYTSLAIGSHTFKVQATDSSNNVETTPPTYTWTVAAPADTTPPTLSLSPANNAANLTGTVTITATASDASGINHVDIYIDNTLVSQDTTSPYTTSWVTTTPSVANGTHTIKAVAYDNAATPNSTTITNTVSVNNDKTAPIAPAVLNATAQSTASVALSWSAASDNIAVTGYRVLRGGSVIATLNNTVYNDNTVTASTTYNYTVVAIDAAGNVSPASPTATVTTPAPPDTTPPPAPTGLSAVINPTNPNQVNLTWNSVTDASGIKGYNVYRNGNKITNTPITTTSYGDGTVSASTTYSYTVKAVDGANNEGPASNTSSVTTPTPTSPSVITTLNFTPTDDSFVNLKRPNSNYGRNTDLISIISPTKYSLYKFNVAGIGTKTVKSAKIRLYVTNSSSYGGAFHQITNNSWSEGTVTWNTKPAWNGNNLATLGQVTSGTWVEADISSLVTKDGTYGILVNSSSSNTVGYSSKETNAKPQLILGVQ